MSLLSRKKVAREHKVSEDSDLRGAARAESKKEQTSVKTVDNKDCILVQKEDASRICFKECESTEKSPKVTPSTTNEKQKQTGVSKITQLKNLFLANISSGNVKPKAEVFVPETLTIEDDTAIYDRVANSINFLIDIEKDFKKGGSDYGVYKILKNSRKRYKGGSPNNEGKPGILESNCLKPSLFKKLAEKRKKLNSGKKLRRQFKSQNPIEDLILNMSSFVITGKPNQYWSEAKSQERTSGQTSSKPQETGLHSKGNEKPVGSDNSSTSISSTYEYNKHIASSSTECLLGNLAKHEKDMPSIKSSASAKSSLTSSVVDGGTTSESKTEGDKKPSVCTENENIGREKNADTKFLTRSGTVVTDSNLDRPGCFQIAKTSSSLKYVSLYRCPEQCDFFKADDFCNEISTHFVGPFNPGIRNNCDKKLRRNLSETDARTPDWTEYCLEISPLSVSAHLLNTFKANAGNKFQSSDKIQAKPFSDIIVPGCSDLPVHATRENDTRFDGAVNYDMSFMCCLTRKPFNGTDVSVNGTELSFNSEGTELTLSQDARSKCSELKSMPCPSLYYHTTWLDSNCSLEAPSEEASLWRKSCNENKDNNSSTYMGLSQGWISIEEDFINGCAAWSKKDGSLLPCENNNHALELKEAYRASALPRPGRACSFKERACFSPTEKKNQVSAETITSVQSGVCKACDVDEHSSLSTPRSQLGSGHPVTSTHSKTARDPENLDEGRIASACNDRYCCRRGLLPKYSSLYDLYPVSKWQSFSIFDPFAMETKGNSTGAYDHDNEHLILYETDL